jgi:3'-phosphoadenosine 5'-phosphosulfate sulfotransferase (PAPS reductase)/FAD synthetase
MPNHLRDAGGRREVAQFERPVLLFSGGKDSIVMVHLARRRSGRTGSLSALHMDTGHNFPETLTSGTGWWRASARARGRYVQDSIDRGKAVRRSRARRQPQRPADRDAPGRDPGATGGRRARRRPARRGEGARQGALLQPPRRLRPVGPEEPAPRAVEPLQRRKNSGEHFRVFPLSNWTEMDVWQYIARERIALPELYFAHEREVVDRGEACFLANTTDVPGCCRRDPRGAPGSLPHHRRRHLHRRHGVGGAATHRGDHPGGGHAHHGERGGRSTTSARRRRWKTGSGRDTSEPSQHRPDQRPSTRNLNRRR